MYLMSRDKCREMDKKAIESIGIPSIVIMENAANEVYLRIREIGKSFVIICGIGNNGGDGLAIGRKLILNNKDVHFVIVGSIDKCTDDFNLNYNIVKNIGGNIYFINNIDELEILRNIINSNEVVIDSIFGVGLNKTLNQFYIKLIDIINNSGKNIISIDVPSGLECDIGIPKGNAVKASTTYTFEVIKKGFINYHALEYLGRLEVIYIGIPEEIKKSVSEEVYILKENEYKNMINKRKIYGHKGDYGRAVIFAGSEGFTGAAYLSAQSCIKTGAGLTTLVTTSNVQEILSSLLIEAMTANFGEKERMDKLIKSADAIAYGPGLPNEKYYEELLMYISNESQSCIVVDAEGINILARRPDILEKLKGRMILTPHPGEMSRLIDRSIEEIESNRISIAKEYAEKYKCIVLLKGYNSIITDGEKVYINTTGNSKMASGGSGDCLTGIIVSLLAQGHEPLKSALIGAYVHGKCGELAGRDKYSITATEIIEEIQTTINNLIM